MTVHLGAVTDDDLRLRPRLDDLYATYTHLLEHDRLEDWLDLFTTDADYRLTARENFERGFELATIRCESRAMLADRVRAIRETQFFLPRVMRRFVSGIYVEGGDAERGWEVSANFLVVESTEDAPSTVHLVGAYHDWVVSDEDAATLRFARKLCVYDSPLVPTSVIYPV